MGAKLREAGAGIETGSELDSTTSDGVAVNFLTGQMW